MKPRTSYKALDVEPVVAHPIDHAVFVRVGWLRLQAELGKRAQAVVDALGRKRRLWFDFEALQGRLTSLREAAYFDLGVEHGIAEARSAGIQGRRRVIEHFAARMVTGALGTNAAREDAVAAAILAAWAVLGGKTGTQVVSARERAQDPA